MRILVLEDEETSKNALIQILKECSAQITVCGAASMREAVHLLHEDREFDLFLLDINLDKADESDASGIAFAKEIRSIYCYELTPIVMITSVAALEMTAFRQIQCYQYILKPFEREAVEAVVHKVMGHPGQVEYAHLFVKKDGINYSIRCQDIIYVKAVPRGVLLCLHGDELEVPYLTLRQILKRLPEDLFFQCHRMFVVNKEYVEFYDMVNQMIKMKGKKEYIDIGVTYKADVRRLLNG